MSVPEIDAPVMNKTRCSTSWDFTYADRMLLDLLANTPNVARIINFTTTPDWMWVTDSYTYPEDAGYSRLRYISIGANILVGLGLALLSTSVLTDAAGNLGTTPWTLPALTLILFACSLILL